MFDNDAMLFKPKQAVYLEHTGKWWIPTHMVTTDPLTGQKTVHQWRVLERTWFGGWKPGNMWRADYE